MNALLLVAALGVVAPVTGRPPLLRVEDSSITSRWQSAITQAIAMLNERQSQVHASGLYRVDYARGHETKRIIDGSISTTFSREGMHSDLRFRHHFEGAPRLIVVRQGSVAFSHRFANGDKSPILALATSLLYPGQQPNRHGLLFDPGYLSLELYNIINIPPKQLRWKEEGKLLHVTQLTNSQPPAIQAEGWFDPATGYLPLKAKFYHSRLPGRLHQETHWTYQKLDDGWHVTSIRQTLHDRFTLNAEDYPMRSTELTFDQYAVIEKVDSKFYQLEALQLPAGAVIADHRKDSPTKWMTLEGNIDPKEQYLDRVLQATLALPLPTRSWSVPWLVVFGCSVGLLFYWLIRFHHFGIFQLFAGGRARLAHNFQRSGAA
jgi:hypothetical protein